jgi:threonylcarbamoyladenosine tRNA methylthiotransferase CDKAL1
VPVQSGSEQVLEKMIRGHDVDDFRFIVNEFRKEIPEITVWTDIIVGFPAETEEDFNKSMKLIEEIKPDFVNISSYSPRHGTRAARMRQLQTEIKKERTRKISEIAKKIYLDRNKQWLGWTGAVIVDEYNNENKNWVGRNYAYKPVVIRGNAELGRILDVEIVDYSHTHLVGKPI